MGMYEVHYSWGNVNRWGYMKFTIFEVVSTFFLLPVIFMHLTTRYIISKLVPSISIRCWADLAEHVIQAVGDLRRVRKMIAGSPLKVGHLQLGIHWSMLWKPWPWPIEFHHLPIKNWWFAIAKLPESVTFPAMGPSPLTAPSGRRYRPEPTHWRRQALPKGGGQKERGQGATCYSLGPGWEGPWEVMKDWKARPCDVATT